MIPLTKSTFYKESLTKKRLISFIRKSDKLSFGPQCEQFENRFAKWQGRKNCVFLNSGSSANLAIIQVLLNLGKIKKGDCVGFSALTWSTNVMPLIQLGLKAIPVDVELDTLNVSSRMFLREINKYPIKALFLTNLLGFCDDIDAIKDICKKKSIILLEDNCESLGTIYKGRKLGNFGVASTFSFYVGHHVSTIEGGAVCTDDDEIVTMLKIVRAHGWDRNLNFEKRNEIKRKYKINSTFYSRYTFYDLGYNFRATEINGFIGNTQLQFIDEILKKRNKNFITMVIPIYKRKDTYFPIRFDHIDFLSNFAVPIVCRSQKIRNELVQKCRGKIEIRPIVGGDITEQPFFTKYMKKYLGGCKNARLVHHQGLYFGNNPELTKKEVKEIIRIFVNV